MMRANGWRWTSFLAVLAILAVAGCGPSAEEQQAQARQAEFEALQEAKDALDASRQQLEEAEAQLEQARSAAGDGEEGEAEGTEAAPTVEEIEARVQELETEVLDQADSLGARLVEFINADPPVEGEELTETQLAAIRMKSDEDIVLAQGYIDEGGDYARAIRFYEDALKVDPENEKLKAALEAASSARYMSQERFAEVKSGMTQDEVRQLLGQVNYRNVREYPEKKVTAWFYPKDELGNAAGVYFRQKGDDLVAYEVNFDAVKAPTQEGG